MLLTEWNIEEAKAVWREEAWEEGWAKGWEEAWEEGWAKGQEEGWEENRNYVLELIAQGLSVEEIKLHLERLKEK